MYDEFYNDSDEGMNIERLSEAEETELHEIEGIESAEEYALRIPVCKSVRKNICEKNNQKNNC